MQLQLGGNSQGLVSLITLLGKQLVPKSYNSLSTFTSAVSLPSIPEKTISALITIETNKTLRYTTDGTTPTATVGHSLSNGDSILLSGAVAIEKFKIIETEASTSAIKITYYV